MWKGSDFVIINWDWFLSPDDLKEGPGIGIGNVRAIRSERMLFPIPVSCHVCSKIAINKKTCCDHLKSIDKKTHFYNMYMIEFPAVGEREEERFKRLTKEYKERANETKRR